MYADPNHRKDNRLTIRLNKAELALITAIADLTGGQPGAIVRELAMEQALRFLATSTTNASSTGMVTQQAA